MMANNLENRQRHFEEEDVGPDNYSVTFETQAVMRVWVNAHSEEEAEELVRSVSTSVDWNDVTIVDMGMHEIDVQKVES